MFVVAELTLRALGAGKPEVAPASSETAVETTLTSPDGRTSKYREWTYVGAPTRTNEKGFRDWLVHEEERGGAWRVAGIGDSFTFGDGLTQDETWLRRLESRLPDVAGRRVTTLNFGRRGSNTADEVGILEHHALAFRPDAVVLGFTLFNDAETTRRRDAAAAEHRTREEGALWRGLRFVHEHVRLVHVVSERARRGRKIADMERHIRAQYDDAAPGWIECRAALGRFAAICRERRLPLAVVLFPAHQRDADLNDWTRYPFRAEHAKVRAALGDAAIPVVDLADELAPLAGQQISIPGNGHPNAAYAERVAEVLAPVVARLLTGTR